MSRWALVALFGWVATFALDVATIATTLTTDVLLRAYGLDGSLNVLLVLALAISAVTLTYATVGALLVVGRRALGVGGLMLFAGLAFAAVPFGYMVGDALSLLNPGAWWATAVLLSGVALNGPAFAAVLPVLALVFPDGRLPSRRWRPATMVAVLAVATASVISVVRPGPVAGAAHPDNPLGIASMPEWLASAAGLIEGLGVLLFAVLGVAAVITRYRSGGSLVRRQIRWFMTAVMLAAVPFVISIQPVIGGPEWFLVSLVGVLLVPVSVWIAVTRHGLYELDRIISRSLSWALLSGVLVAVYAGGVLVLQSLLAGVTQGETLAVAASTLVAFALFQPIRRRVQRAVDRRFDRARYDSQRTVDAFAGQARNEVDLARLSAALLLTTHQAVRPRDASVWLRGAST
ncbi:MAG: hypothetical protein ABIQ17_01460 [Candidatus Limnocylindrales bacterium]